MVILKIVRIFDIVKQLNITVMKINLRSTSDRPMVTSFTVFSKLNREQLLEDKGITIDSRWETKTRLSTTFQHRDYRVQVNLPIEGFKTVEKEEHSMLSGNTNVSNYFVVSKKQGMEEYKKYVEKVVEHVIVDIFKLQMDEINVTLLLPR